MRITTASVSASNFNRYRMDKKCKYVAALCWIFGLIVSVPNLFLYDVTYALIPYPPPNIKMEPAQQKFINLNNMSFNDDEYGEMRLSCEQYIFGSRDEILNKFGRIYNKSAINSLDNQLKNFLSQLSSRYTPLWRLNNQYRSCREKKIRLLMQVSKTRLEMPIYRTDSYIPYGHLSSRNPRISRIYKLESTTSKNGVSSDYELIVDCACIKSSVYQLIYAIFVSIMVFFVPSVWIIINYAIITCFLVKTNKKIFAIATRTAPIFQDISNNNINIQNCNNLFREGARIQSLPGTKFNKFKLRDCFRIQKRPFLGKVRKIKFNIIKMMCLLSFLFIISWLPFFVLYLKEV
ncbi:unnamed protein product [Gordionus sp. m RMFG-2023]